MVLTFVGLSGSGKSSLSHRFVHELQWKAYHCDELIEVQLFGEIPHSQPVATRRLAGWLGQPYSPAFAERQEKYLYAEQLVLKDICAAIDRRAEDEKIIIDSTGSFIYMDDPTIAEVRKRSTVVYFEMPDSDEEQLFEQYLADPKPVVWRNLYDPRDGEDKIDALHRCYAELMHERGELYAKYADVTVSAAFAERERLTPELILNAAGLK